MSRFKFKQIMANRNQVVQTLIDDLKKSEGTWTKDYYESLIRPHNPFTKSKYTGANLSILRSHMYRRGMNDTRFMTFNQIKEAGYRLKSNAQGIPLERWIGSKVEEIKDDEGLKETLIQSKASNVVLAKIFYVFSVEDLENYTKPLTAKLTDIQRYQSVLDIANALNIKIEESKTLSNPAYLIQEDKIVMPPQDTYKSNDLFFATLLHEIVHATGAKERLNRFDEVPGISKQGYAREELIAEFTALQLAKSLDFEFEDLESIHKKSHLYLKSWIGALENDFNEFYRTAKESEKVLGYIEKELEIYHQKDLKVEQVNSINDSIANQEKTNHKQKIKM